MQRISIRQLLVDSITVQSWFGFHSQCESRVRATPVILLILIVCLPLGVLAWLGQRLESDERTVIEQRFRGLLTAQLKDIDQITIGHFANTQREL